MKQEIFSSEGENKRKNWVLKTVYLKEGCLKKHYIMPHNFKRIKLFIHFIFFITLISSCNLTRNSSSIKMGDGYYYYEQISPRLKISLLGDYIFQPLSTKYFRDIDKDFIKYVKNRIVNKRPSILYQAHTIIQPYYSTICMQYHTSVSDSTFLNELTSQLKNSFKIRLSKVDHIKYGNKNIYKLKYQITNSITKTTTAHTEYFFKNENNIYRFLFWTTNSDDTIISEEAEYIIKEMSFD